MVSYIRNNHRLFFYGLWLLMSLIQSGFTELLDDEAYYWVYGQYLDWGYFDHPPMIGLLVKAGYAIFPNELGVRLFPLLLNFFTLFIIEELTEKKNPFLFYAIIFSIGALQVSGFVAVPDIPLIFFTALFFLCYKNFIASSSLVNTILLGIVIALMLYSKYHAGLIILFTVISNRQLFFRYQFYLAGLIAFLLFAPHLWWQYQHDWISFRFHLFERNTSPYKFYFPADYLLGQLLISGPFTGFILLPAAFLFKPVQKTEKALWYSLAGVYVFFFLSSFRGKVEANWTSPAAVPLIILAHQFLTEKEKWRTLLVKILPATVFLVVAARIVMIADIVPVRLVEKKYHDWKEWPAEMKKRTAGLPVVIGNSYQQASKYWFYTGQPAYSLNFYRARRNNYNFWPMEDSLLGKPVYILDKYDLWRFPDSLKTHNSWVGYKYDPFFVSFAKIRIDAGTRKIYSKKGSPVLLSCYFDIPPLYSLFLDTTKTDLKDTIRIGVFNRNGWVKDIFPGINLRQAARQKNMILNLVPELPKGKYYLRFAISCGSRLPTHNSEKIMFTVN